MVGCRRSTRVTELHLLGMSLVDSTSLTDTFDYLSSKMDLTLESITWSSSPSSVSVDGLLDVLVSDKSICLRSLSLPGPIL